MSDASQIDLHRRPRRNRFSPAIRALTTETSLGINDLICPLFVKDGNDAPSEVVSMPGVFRYNIPDLVNEAGQLAALGIKAIAIFPYTNPSLKTPRGEEALNPGGLIPRAVQAIKKHFPGLLLITDVALDPYTGHGHDGVLNEQGYVDNDLTVKILGEMAVLLAQAGADVVAPSDMMDGRVRAIRKSLDREGLVNTAILAYSVKFASAFYGPFRDAVGSAQAAGTHLLDKKTYQMNPANRREALLEAQLDEEEGADILMVKPAGPYLDIIREVRNQTTLPIAAYQVSGEYAQIHAAARLGWLDLELTAFESLLSIKRAGADMVLTYFSKQIAQKIRG